jgi:hypothetical protein
VYEKFLIFLYQKIKINMMLFYYKIPFSKLNQKYIYIVHNQCDKWSESDKQIIKNNDKYIDSYIFV